MQAGNQPAVIIFQNFGGKSMNTFGKDLDFDSQKFENSPWLLKDFCDWSFVKKYGIMTRYKKGTILHSYDVKDSIF
jgi:hypothetical protein